MANDNGRRTLDYEGTQHVGKYDKKKKEKRKKKKRKITKNKKKFAELENGRADAFNP